MYVMLQLATEKAPEMEILLHLNQAVTVLYLDKQIGLWQYIVEVFRR